jgi:hypothetical protein
MNVWRVLRRLRSGLLFLFCLFVLCLVLGFGYATWRLRQVEQGWASSFESTEAFAARFPRTATSSGAWQLRELTRPLGIDMVGQTAASSAQLNAISAFVKAQHAVVDDATRTPPAAVTQFLGEHARHIDAIEANLLGGSEVSWECDFVAGFAEPHTSLLGHSYLQNILLARALEESRDGRLVEAAPPHRAKCDLPLPRGARKSVGFGRAELTRC